MVAGTVSVNHYKHSADTAQPPQELDCCGMCNEQDLRKDAHIAEISYDPLVHCDYDSSVLSNPSWPSHHGRMQG